ncbi:Ca2+-binding protein, RTX toxin-related [Roseivivax sediminis]|uniref:Ca2+-binding protein, RTX toxin-related n=1 Tax=Roseivivax sediminis TaxID=936889 RepID=A0A1I1XSP0_9RHOB|nr:Ca2+-binding protein, RTX toxin-related [Roseivivax sediminis]
MNAGVGVPVTIQVLGNDSDPDGDILGVTFVSQPANGSVVLNDDNTITYTSAGDFTGVDTFTYEIDDGRGGTDTAEVTVTVSNDGDGNTPPTAVDDDLVTTVDTPVTADLLANDTDPDDDILGVSFLGTPENGTVTQEDPLGPVVYTPNPGFTGTDSFTYEVDDAQGGTDFGTATVTVNVGDGGGPENSAPEAVDDSASTDVGTPVTVSVLDNDTDADGDPLTITDVSDPANGAVNVNEDGTVTYTPDAGFVGDDSVTYTVDDGNGGTGTATLTVSVEDGTGGDGGGGDGDGNTAPDAVDDTATTTEGEPVTIDILANDTDADGDILGVSFISTPENGTVTQEDPLGPIVYTPNPGFVGTETLTYEVDDGQAGENATDTATITITVTESDVPPDGIVEGSDGPDLIDEDYTGDPDTPPDMIDNEDAIIEGDGPNDDRVVAGGGDDTVNAGQGSDTVQGGDGDDLINAGKPVTEGAIDTDVVPVGDLPEGSPFTQEDDPFNGFDEDDDPEDDRDSVEGGAGNDTIFTGDDRDTINGGTGDDVLDAGVDDDLVYGGDGNNLITDPQGADTVYGGAGDDTILVGTDTYTDVPTEDYPAPLGFEGDPNTDDGRDLVFGGDGNDVIQTGDDADTIDGGAGDDTIDAGIDDDEVTGGDGADSIVGGQGSDTIDGGAGSDTIEAGADADRIVVGSAEEGAGDIVYGGSEGDDFDTLDLTGVGADGFRLTNVTPDDDGPDRESNGIDGTVEFLDTEGNVTGTLDFFNIEEVIPCFTPGTLIATPQGERLVEELREGDRIITRDNGIQEIRWLGRKDLTPFELARAPHMKPVLIQKGALGNGLPTHDLLVSPNHRVLVNNDKTALYFEDHEVLAAAKHLTGLEGVDEVTSLGVSYIHFMFDAHEVVLSNGAWTESFQPGDYSLKGIGNAQREEILELFPELEHDQGLRAYASARRSLKRHEAELLTR